MSPPTDVNISFDGENFKKELMEAKKAAKPTDEENHAHMRKLEMWTTTLGILGFCLCIRGKISLLGMFFLGWYRFSKYSVIGHYSLHGAWGTERKGTYAQGLYRRIIDWLDWLFPMAWAAGHNKVHHYHVNETIDPDNMERNVNLKEMLPTMPVWAHYMVMTFIMFTWRWLYQASNTLKYLHAEKDGAPTGEDLHKPLTLRFIVSSALGYNKGKGSKKWYTEFQRDLFLNVLFPNFFATFMVVPWIAGVFQHWMSTGQFEPASFCLIAFLNMCGADAVTNFQAFLTGATNHAGDDMWTFTNTCKPNTPEFIVRATIASAAYPVSGDYPICGDVMDFFHGFQGYQIEHHAFPDCGPLHLKNIQPDFKRICSKYGVPYVQESVWIRLIKTLQVMVGQTQGKEMRGNAVDHPELWMTTGAIKH